MTDEQLTFIERARDKFAEPSHTSQVDDARLVRDPIGIWMERPVVDETQQRSWSYPESLVTEAHVRIADVTVMVHFQRPSKPEAAARVDRVFKQILDAVEDIIRGGNSPILADQNQTHRPTPSVDPTVEEPAS